MAELSGTEEIADNKLQVTEFISVSELANLMDVGYADVIGKCMSLGMMVSINQRLEADVIELVAGEFGYVVEFIGIDDAAEMEDDDFEDVPEDLQPRSPIVTIMSGPTSRIRHNSSYCSLTNMVGWPISRKSSSARSRIHCCVVCDSLRMVRNPRIAAEMYLSLR